MTRTATIHFSLNLVQVQLHSGWAAVKDATYGFAVAEEAFAKAGVQLLTLTDYDAVVDEALRTGYISHDDLPLLAQWRQNPGEWKQ